MIGTASDSEGGLAQIKSKLGQAWQWGGQATNPLKESGGQLIVCIDAGHGGNDPGCVAGDTYESHQTLELALAMRDAMEAQGITVVMTREDDTYVALEERANIANQAGADYFISIHRNTLVGGGAQGVEIWHSCHAGSDTLRFASLVEDRLVEAGISKDRGCRGGSQGDANEDYIVCRETAMPAVLVEMGFMSDETDNNLFYANQTAYAEAFANAVLDAWQEGQQS
jgi:N-acetylmuramoyl-L-alanine amidase